MYIVRYVENLRELLCLCEIMCRVEVEGFVLTLPFRNQDCALCLRNDQQFFYSSILIDFI